MSTGWQTLRTHLGNPFLRGENSGRVSDPNLLVVGGQIGERRAAFSLACRLPCLCLDLHHGLDLVKMPRAKLVGIDAYIKGERLRLVRQVAVRVSIKVPRALLRIAGQASR